MAVQLGESAPDFDLPATVGGRVSLSGLRGQKVVLIFFPFAFSGICTGELCMVRDMAGDFSDLDAVVLGISCDPWESLRAFAAQESLQHPLLSDFWPHGEISRKYGVFVEAIGAADRGTFVIDREGRLAGTVVTELGRPREAADYTRILASLD